MHRAAVLAVALAALAFAGCLGAPAAPLDAEGDRLTLPPSGPAFPRLDLADCTEGGGHSNYNLDLLQGLMPEPWILADVTEDIGPVTVTNTVPPTPATGPQSGIYHAAFRCGGFLLDGEEQGPLSGGYVGIRVEPPPFDTGGAARHYLVITFSTDHAALNQLLNDAGYHVPSASVVVEQVGPLFHSVLDDAEHGVYEAHFQPVEAGAKWEGTLRLWLQLGAEQGHHGGLAAQAHDAIRPVALDLTDAGGTHLHARDASAVFSHSRTTDHDQNLGGVTVPVPAVAGTTAGLGYVGFTRSLTLGPQPDYRLAEAWDHV